ncbi:MAG: thymidylate synthase, partial [Nitrosopumilus sp.]
WLLAGRNDTESLLPYNKRILEFSDDGESMYGAYGYRIKEQIWHLIARLKNEATDRRAVLIIWGADDLIAETKDPPCLAGDTIILSPEGNFSIRDSVGKRVPIFTFSEGKRKLAWAVGSYSGKRTTLSVRLDNGSTVRLTSDHLVMVQTRKKVGRDLDWVKAEDLKVGDRLLPIHFSIGEKGHLLYSTHHHPRTVHKAYYELAHGKVPKGYQVHHLNHNPLDNHIENLAMVTISRHFQYHKDNPDGKSYRHKNGNAVGELDLLEMGRKLLIETGKLTFHLFNHTYGPKISAGTILSRWGKWSNYRSAVEDNHKIVAIEDGDEEDVYDLTVEGNDNFFLAAGVLVHNCNTQVMFKLRGKQLHMSVINRSNDLHWGLHAVNLFQFGVLQEYIACRLGADMGTQTHFSNSLHVYTDEKARDITQRMIAEIKVPIDEMGPGAWLFPNPFPLEMASYEVFSALCGTVLDGSFRTDHNFPFLEFASDFLALYREPEVFSSKNIRHQERYEGWMQMGIEFNSKLFS